MELPDYTEYIFIERIFNKRCGIREGIAVLIGKVQ